MNAEHIVKAFDDELKKLDEIIVKMGVLAKTQLADAMDGILSKDLNKADSVIESDKKIDELEIELEAVATSILALRQPMAEDLRLVICALKTSAVLERIGDYSKNIARKAITLSQAPLLAPLHPLTRMGNSVQKMIEEVLEAYANRDAKQADNVWYSDQEVDDLHASLFREMLTYMMEDPRAIGPGTHLLFVARYLERIGDHTTNIAENIHVAVHGKPIDDDRPKGAGPDDLADDIKV